MIERDLQDAVLELAGLLGYRAIHHRPARTSRGWRTPLQGPGSAGFPDCVLVHPQTGHILFIELKAGRGKLRPEQEEWRDILLFAGARYHLFNDGDWTDGVIETVLLEAAGKTRRAA